MVMCQTNFSCKYTFKEIICGGFATSLLLIVHISLSMLVLSSLAPIFIHLLIGRIFMESFSMPGNVLDPGP